MLHPILWNRHIIKAKSQKLDNLAQPEFNFRARFLKFPLWLQMPRFFGFRFQVSVMKNDQFYQNLWLKYSHVWVHFEALLKPYLKM